MIKKEQTSFLILAIDFDGGIVENKWPKIGKLKKNAKKVINRLYDEGHEILVWTCRTSIKIRPNDPCTLDDMRKFLDKKGIKYHSINSNTSRTFQSTPKIYAHLYIDDRNLGGIPDDWEEIYEQIKNTKIVRDYFE